MRYAGPHLCGPYIKDRVFNPVFKKFTFLSSYFFTMPPNRNFRSQSAYCDYNGRPFHRRQDNQWKSQTNLPEYRGYKGYLKKLKEKGKKYGDYQRRCTYALQHEARQRRLLEESIAYRNRVCDIRDDARSAYQRMNKWRNVKRDRMNAARRRNAWQWQNPGLWKWMQQQEW
jgi:hypothetical protein